MLLFSCSFLLCSRVNSRDSSILLHLVSSGRAIFALSTFSTYALDSDGTWRLVEWWYLDREQWLELEELRVHSWEIEEEVKPQPW